MRSLTTHAVIALVIPTWLIACSNSPTDPSCTVNSVTITGAPTALETGATVQLGTTIDSDDCSPAPTATWSTSSGAIATVSNTGLVTGVSAGEVTITATAGGKSGTATFDVEVTPVASVRLSTDEIVIGVGPAATLMAEALDAEDNVLPGRTVTWAVTDGSGATISNTGELTGVTVGGTATITATIEGVEAEALVQVVRSRLAYFWNNLQAPGAGPVSLSNSYMYNSLGGALQVSSGSTGSYSASFVGQGRETVETEAFFMSPYGEGAGSYCFNDGWNATTVSVVCSAADGTPVNTRFTVAHISSAAFGGRFGYTWIPDGDESTPGSSNYSYSSAGGAIASTRNGVGDYTVRFSGLGRKTAADREGVLSNAYATNAHCQPSTWTTVGNDLDVGVRCFGPTGGAIDSPFVVGVFDGNRSGARLGFAHADQPTTGAYAPANSAVRPSGGVQVSHSGTGAYTVEFTGLYRSGDLVETFLVTATGSTPGRCGIISWGESSAPAEPTEISIGCTNVAGVATDMPFSIVALQ